MVKVSQSWDSNGLNLYSSVIFSIYDIDKDGNITKADLLKVIFNPS